MTLVATPEQALPLDLQVIAESDYEGWVAWVADSEEPIFEHVEWNPKLLPIHDQTRERGYRGTSRRVMEWKDLPKHKLSRVALFFCREQRLNGMRYLMPNIVIDRPPGRADIIFIQMKMGSVILNTGGGEMEGQKRSGVSGYKIGFWDPVSGDCVLYTFTRVGPKEERCTGHPCWPRPLGFGLNPRVVGLVEAPPVPEG